MLEATKLMVAVKNIETPDERHAFEHASLNVVNLPGVTIARTVYQPGWKWSTDVKPVVGTEACQAAHTGYIISGRLHARMDDGREYDFGPGDAHVVSAGHDAWVEGDEPCVALDLAFTGRALAGHVGRCPCGVEFRVASDDQFGQLVAAMREHARSSHGHELTTQQVLAEVMALGLLSGTCTWILRSDSTTSPSQATSGQSGNKPGNDHDPRYRRDATSASPAAVRSRTHGGHWKITQYMYQQLPEQSEGAALASSESATRIRARSASACGRRARRVPAVTLIYLPVQGPGR
jgi:hypothetical protein